jgi:hypothetical protein
VPDKVIAAVNYNLPFRHKGLLRKTSLNLFYSGYSASGYSFAYTNDMNGDGINNDMMYIRKMIVKSNSRMKQIEPLSGTS